MLYIESIYETYTEHTGNDDEPWSGPDHHTDGTLPLREGATDMGMINAKLRSVGLPELTPENIASGAWTVDEDDDGMRCNLAFIGTSNGTPDDSGSFHYWCTMVLTVHTERPASLTDLFPL